jgi:uncharacterized protein involved in tolerance to divalent cations
MLAEGTDEGRRTNSSRAGDVRKAREYLLVMKTTSKRLAELEREVKRVHSYDVPEFISIPITEGSEEYLSWLDASVSRAHKNRK